MTFPGVMLGNTPICQIQSILFTQKDIGHGFAFIPLVLIDYFNSRPRLRINSSILRPISLSILIIIIVLSQ